MSITARSFCRFSPVIRSGVRPVVKLNGRINTSWPFTRSLWHLTGTTKHCNIPASTLCSCGCGIHGMHTRGDRELVEFLQEEIVVEKKNLQSGGYLPSHIDNFAIKANGAELTLTKSFHDEQISVSLNVNHTVDGDAPIETNEQGDMGELMSQPSFKVDFKIGSTTMSFTCSYTGPSEVGADQSDDEFGINEVTIYEGEWGEETYCVSGDKLDGMMYDLLMNLLEERDINNEFVEKLSTLFSDAEHGLYVNFLQEI